MLLAVFAVLVAWGAWRIYRRKDLMPVALVSASAGFIILMITSAGKLP